VRIRTGHGPNDWSKDIDATAHVTRIQHGAVGALPLTEAIPMKGHPGKVKGMGAEAGRVWGHQDIKGRYRRMAAGE